MTLYEKEIKKNKTKRTYAITYAICAIAMFILCSIEYSIPSIPIFYWLIMGFGTIMSIMNIYFYIVTRKQIESFKDTLEKYY